MKKQSKEAGAPRDRVAILDARVTKIEKIGHAETLELQRSLSRERRRLDLVVLALDRLGIIERGKLMASVERAMDL